MTICHSTLLKVNSTAWLTSRGYKIFDHVLPHAIPWSMEVDHRGITNTCAFDTVQMAVYFLVMQNCIPESSILAEKLNLFVSMSLIQKGELDYAQLLF